MNDTRFENRSSEWLGDMTVWMRANAQDNSEQLRRLRRNLRRAREQELTDRQRPHSPAGPGPALPLFAVHPVGPLHQIRRNGVVFLCNSRGAPLLFFPKKPV